MIAITSLAVLYYVVLAAPLYTSEAKFAIKGRQPQVASPLLAALAPQAGAQEGFAVVDYVRSPEMLDALNREVRLRDSYSRFRLDPLYQLKRNASRRDFMKFYRSLVSIDVDSASSILTLRVAAFEPAAAHGTARAVLANTADFVNNLSRQMLNESTRASESELEIARGEAIQARLAVARFQSSSGKLNPGTYGEAAGGAVFSLESEIARLRSQFASLRTYSTATSPQVKQIVAQIASLEAQEARIKSGLTGNGPTVSTQLNSFQGLAARQTYADQHLAAAQAALDQSRAAATQRQMFLVMISAPDLPDEATPRRLRGFVTVLLVAACIYGIAGPDARQHQGSPAVKRGGSSA